MRGGAALLLALGLRPLPAQAGSGDLGGVGSAPPEEDPPAAVRGVGLHAGFAKKEPLEDLGRPCDVEAVELANSRQLNSILEELTNTTYFRLFRVDLNRPCPFWKETAGAPTCTAPPPSAALAPEAPTLCSLTAGTNEPPTAHVNKSLSRHEVASLPTRVRSCDSHLPEFWLDMCSSSVPSPTAEHVNLQLNPERWTGYNGSKIWEAIYHENCFARAGAAANLCFEERVLWRLLSGMHTSIDMHITLSYFPPRKGKRDRWEPNPRRFMEHYLHHPERLKNLHFSFVVLLRALKKLAPTLGYHSTQASIDPALGPTDELTVVLMRRLLDSQILQSCRGVFDAFDESLMFPDSPVSDKSTLANLKADFKGIFQNISGILDCIPCQKCKLHGKLQLLGLGAALRVLLIPESLLLTNPLTREELVALVNTLGKFSTAITYVDHLWQLVRDSGGPPEMQPPRAGGARLAAPPPGQPGAAPGGGGAGGEGGGGTADAPAPQTAPADPEAALPQAAWPPEQRLPLADAAVAAIAAAAAGGDISAEDETALLDLCLSGDTGALLLAKHYAAFPARFARHALRHAARAAAPQQPQPQQPATAGPVAALGGGADDSASDAVIVGGGLAGLTAGLVLLDRGARVTLLEKEGAVGGNSAKASSGVNAALPGTASGDSVEAYAADTRRSAGAGEGGTAPNYSAELVAALAEGSGAALRWLQQRIGIALAPNPVQLGGHSHPRTFRPAAGLAGTEMILALKKHFHANDPKLGGRLRVHTRATVTALLMEGGRVAGVRWRDAEGKLHSETARGGVLLATGGFASGGNSSLLSEVRRDLVGFATTNGPHATGDGHRLARSVGGALVGMEDVQVHPTGFVDDRHPESPTKTLCAELLRGVGGLLLLPNATRFADELGTRRYLSERMLQNGALSTGVALVLHDAAAAKADRHVPLYSRRGLLHRFDDLAALAAWMSRRWGGPLEAIAAQLRATLVAYNDAAAAGRDEHGKVHFHSTPVDLAGGFYAGVVVPVVHYTMGGVRFDARARVLGESGDPVPGLWAAGEITGGLHGINRLGGNALTECLVFGMAAGADIPVARATVASQGSAPPPAGSAAARTRTITAAELQQHNNEGSCWVAIHGKVYDLTTFASEHPGGAEAVTGLAGAEGTQQFAAAHSPTVLEDFDPLGDYQP
eukprot:TRINITY_DN6609_c0_g1_i1.p1 TRINITY_DN6609_c0_g1~~TRINITY_DN6609_c0_g1_i1.p1  ORF type:complete len:1174 (+),score=354.62 TRINITY_DN6609_c0_g1_i1:114-3635(+)